MVKYKTIFYIFLSGCMFAKLSYAAGNMMLYHTLGKTANFLLLS